MNDQPSVSNDASRKKRERKRKRRKQLAPCQVWNHKDDHPQIKQLSKQLNDRRGLS